MELDEYFKKILSLPEYMIELGVYEDSEPRESEKGTTSGVTNAQLMWILHQGSPLNHVPPRPVFTITIEHANKKMLVDNVTKAFEDWTDSDCDITVLERDLKQFGERLVNYAKDVVYNNDGRLARNAPSTIKHKGFDHPLFYTGQLVNSFTYRLVKL